AQGIPHVLKVLVTCTDDLDRATRLSRRDEMSPEEAFMKAYKRLEINVQKWSRLYSPEWDQWIVQPGILHSRAKIFFWNPRLYDLVIDTAKFDENQALMMVLTALNFSMVKGIEARG